MAEKPSTRRYNNYSLAILLSFLAGIAVTLALLLTAHSALGEMPQWLYELLCAIFGMVSVSQIVSGSGYSFTGFDILTNGDVTLVQVAECALDPKYKRSSFFNFMRERKMEFVGLTVGFLVALALTIALVVKKAASIFVTVFPVVGTIVFFLTNVSAISGLCSRLGRCADYFRKFGSGLRGENINYVISVLAGAVIGIILASVFLGVGGVTSVMTAGGAIPLWFGAAVFFITTVSTCASASGYIGRWWDFVLGEKLFGMSKDSNDTGLKNRVNAERIGTAIGITIGIALGATLIATGLALTPMLGMGLPLWAAGILVMAGSVSAMGGLGNRLGYCVDLFVRGVRGDNEHTRKASNPHLLSPAPNPDGSSSNCNDWKDATTTTSLTVKIITGKVKDSGYAKDGNKVKKVVVAPNECKMDIIEPEVKNYEIPLFGKSRFSFHKSHTVKPIISKAVSPQIRPRATAAPAA